MDKRKQAWHDIRERRGLTLTPYRGWRWSVIWTVGEDDDLRAQVAAGARFEDIAAWHMRSEGGIGTRMQELDLMPTDTELLDEEF